MNKRLALIVQKYFEFGGKEKFFEQLAIGLSKRGYDVHILARKWDSPATKDLSIPVHRISIVPGDGWIKAWSFATNVQKFLAQNSFDYSISVEKVPGVDSYITCDGCFQERLLQRKKFNGPIGRAMLRYNPRYVVMRALERRLFESPKLKGIVAISQKMKNEILQHYKQLPEETVHVVYHGVSPQIISKLTKQQARDQLEQELSIPKDRLIFLCVGSNFDGKGVKYIFQAMAQFSANENLHLVVVGKGDISTFQKLATELKIGDSVTMTGPRQDVNVFYRAADAFVLPSRHETFGLVYLEAMLHRLPIVISATAGASELVENGESGIILQNPQDGNEVHQAMSQLLDQEKRKCLAEKGEKIAQKYTLQYNIEEIIRVLALGE